MASQFTHSFNYLSIYLPTDLFIYLSIHIFFPHQLETVDELSSIVVWTFLMGLCLEAMSLEFGFALGTSKKSKPRLNLIHPQSLIGERKNL